MAKLVEKFNQTSNSNILISENQIITVIMECGKLVTGAALPETDNWNGSFSSERFRTMTTIFPSGLRKAVD